MDQTKLEQICRAVGECVKHADAATANRRKQLVETVTQPIVITRFKPQPTVCGDCGLRQPDRISQLHSLKLTGWKTWCNSCKLTRQPGTDYFGIKPKVQDLFNAPAPAPEPSTPPQIEPQSAPIENDPNENFVVEVIVRESHESVIREFVRTPIESQSD